MHKADGPRIIGELGSGDALEISKVTLKAERHAEKWVMKMDLKSRKFGDLARLVCNYPFVKVVSIEAIDSEDVVVQLGAGNKKIQAQYTLEKEGACWDATARSTSR
ncbi:MAG TPA: hypothetical protein VFB72_00095 [Verrucomicrobiae bacterium]|nr:hypothetical protein [Verrucomicrobiae bacterium]